MEDRCVCCGKIIPEGRQVCKNCVDSLEDKWKAIERDRVIFNALLHIADK